MKHELEHGTAKVQLTTPEENMTDLAHLFVNMAFVAGFTHDEVMLNIKRVINEQYFQSITRTRV